MIELIEIYRIFLGMLSGVFFTVWYTHYFSKYDIVKEGIYYLKKDVTIDGKLFALHAPDEGGVKE